MKNLFKKSDSEAGFTLIELLVVIAIIAILSTIVLASLAAARSRAQEAKITSQLAQIPAAIELGANSGTYTTLTTGTCPTAAGTVGMWDSAASGIISLIDFNKYPGGSAPICYSDVGSYTFQITSNASGTTKNYCVDLAGVKIQGTGGATGATTTTAPYKCN